MKSLNFDAHAEEWQSKFGAPVLAGSHIKFANFMLTSGALGLI
jgi:hypothetical protein